MKPILSVIVLLLGVAVLVQCDEDWMNADEPGQADSQDDLSGAFRTLREATQSHSRLKRACTWWFQWKVTGAQVDNVEVTNQLDDLFRKVCNKFGK